MQNLNGYRIIVEVKKFLRFPRKTGKIIGNRGEILAYRLDEETTVRQQLNEVNRKYSEIISKHPMLANLPYVFIVFEEGWFWDYHGFLNNEIYKDYPNISAVMRLVKSDPKQDEWQRLSLEDLRLYIENDGGKSRSRSQYSWQVVLNCSATISLKPTEFPGIEKIRI